MRMGMKCVKVKLCVCRQNKKGCVSTYIHSWLIFSLRVGNSQSVAAMSTRLLHWPRSQLERAEPWQSFLFPVIERPNALVSFWLFLSNQLDLFVAPEAYWNKNGIR